MNLSATIGEPTGSESTAAMDAATTTAGATADDGTGLVAGQLLIAYAEAVVRATDDVERLRSQLLDRLGPDATGHAAATITAFSGLVRVADGTGIPIDDGLAAVSADIRRDLSLEKLGGAANSSVDHVPESDFTTVGALFGMG